MNWRTLFSSPADGATNMATDHTLMQRARESGEGVLRVYSWSGPVLSFGRNQLARGLYDEHVLQERGITCVRRPTGGRALLHHHEVTYSVTRPVAGDESLRGAYAGINTLVLGALRSLGVDAAIAEPASPARSPGGAPCFAEPSRGEIVAGGRKLAGSAQWRDDGLLLQHGSILVEDDQSSIGELMYTGAGAVPRPATLRELMHRSPPAHEVAEALFSSLRELTGADGSFAEDVAPAPELLEKYRAPSWTWRR